MQDQELTHVVIHDIDMSLWRLVVFNMKWFVAAIPALVIMTVFMTILMAGLVALGLYPDYPYAGY